MENETLSECIALASQFVRPDDDFTFRMAIQFGCGELRMCEIHFDHRAWNGRETAYLIDRETDQAGTHVYLSESNQYLAKDQASVEIDDWIKQDREDAADAKASE